MDKRIGVQLMACTTYNLRFVDDGEWYRGFRTRKLENAKAQARLVEDTTGRKVAVYGGEGPYRNEVWRAERQPISPNEPGMGRVADR